MTALLPLITAAAFALAPTVIHEVRAALTRRAELYTA